MSSNDIYFEAETPLKKKIRTTKEYWEFIVKVKHPIMRGRKEDVVMTLKDPEFIRQSRKDLMYIFITAELEISLSVLYANI